MGLSRAGRKLKTVRKPDAGRQKAHVYPGRHWWVGSREPASRLTRNCGHRYGLVTEAFACLADRPGEHVFLVYADET